jgi:hypothetical protein
MAPHRQIGLIFIAAVAGCGSGSGSDPQACTLIGCDSGIEVVLDQAPTAPYRVEAYTPSQQQRHVYRCEPSSCPPRIMFSGFTPDRAIIEVIAQQDTSRHEVTPSYVESRPNGPRCDPVCRNATVRLSADPSGLM